MNNTLSDNALLARWLKGDVSDAERVEIEQHPDFPALRRLLVAQGKFPTQKQGPRSRKDSLRLQWGGLAVVFALSVALLSWAMFLSVPCPPTISATAKGEQQTVEFPDGSSVRLNAVSAAEIVPDNWANERRVLLLGEGFFQVKKNPVPFVVETLAGTVSVLGTNFNVRYRGNAFEVACYTGFVQVTTNQGDQQALRGGQKSVARNGRWQHPISTITDPWPAWMQGESRFGDAPMHEVFAELSRQYDIAISAADLQGHQFSGRFVHGDLHRALKMVCEPLGTQYELEGKTVLIRQKQ